MAVCSATVSFCEGTNFLSDTQKFLLSKEKPEIKSVKVGKKTNLLFWRLVSFFLVCVALVLLFLKTQNNKHQEQWSRVHCENVCGNAREPNRQPKNNEFK